MKGLTNSILMIRPRHFGFNEETAQSNAFQVNKGDVSIDEIKQLAIQEVNQFVSTLREAGVHVELIEDDGSVVRPDAVFPNNWISFHESGELFLYPMMSEKRRLEVRKDVVEGLKEKFGYSLIDWTSKTEDDLFLEGTGSLVLDRVNRVVYACYSPRTNNELLREWAKLMNYHLIAFNATDEAGQEIYHTNVLMAMGHDFVVICLDAIQEIESRERILESFDEAEKEVIEIDFQQMNQFAGNMLEVIDDEGQPLLVMSKSAYGSLDEDVINRLTSHAKIVTGNLSVIEQYGGGSVRCTMAELFLPESKI